MNEKEIREETKAVIKEAFPELADKVDEINDEMIQELKDNKVMDESGEFTVGKK